MMSEDETTKDLCRVDFLSLVFIINELSDDESESIRQNKDLMDQFFKKYGWTTEEVKERMEGLLNE